MTVVSNGTAIPLGVILNQDNLTTVQAKVIAPDGTSTIIDIPQVATITTADSNGKGGRFLYQVEHILTEGDDKVVKGTHTVIFTCADYPQLALVKNIRVKDFGDDDIEKIVQDTNTKINNMSPTIDSIQADTTSLTEGVFKPQLVD